jgi:hypothetical protein
MEAIVSERGLRLFRDYVDNKLTERGLAALLPEDHAQNLITEADAAGMPILEITEEVGVIADALAVMKERKER